MLTIDVHKTIIVDTYPLMPRLFVLKRHLSKFSLRYTSNLTVVDGSSRCVIRQTLLSWTEVIAALYVKPYCRGRKFSLRYTSNLTVVDGSSRCVIRQTLLSWTEVLAALYVKPYCRGRKFSLRYTSNLTVVDGARISETLILL
ncbi:hypothetical protein DPMN_106206 [Dreissena polymorpha]|uniref:Uncharacterized protein n=1 Tax=Dreissena polymorpha TaxID=45954 RepID=A0A9D4K4K6_DREPO|nr:hypothetical protein DPMN_106206 [Dreissena polymorpha]